MMSYCNIDDVVHEFHPTLKINMERDYGDEFQEIISRHIEKAEAFINASLARVYSVPLKKAASTVISAECKLAAYYAAIAYSEKDEVVRDKYEIAHEMLDNLVAANNPALVDEEFDNKNYPADVYYSSDEQIFSSDELKKW